MKFDVVVGNPPYQAPQNAKGKRGGGTSLWDKFVEKALDELLQKDGYLCFVHPARWRKPEDALWDKMTQHQIYYLEIHNAQDGQKTFGAGTRYDWYVLQKKPYHEPTVVRDEKHEEHNINLSLWPWLPNYAFELIKSIMISNENEGIDIIFSTVNDFKDNQSESYRHKCIHTITNTNGIRIKYVNCRNEKHFVPKVVFSDGGPVIPVIDIKGAYGMTQQAIAIPVTNIEEALLVKRALESEAFQYIIKATKWSLYRTEWRMFKYFKKDFWKDYR